MSARTHLVWDDDGMPTRISASQTMTPTMQLRWLVTRYDSTLQQAFHIGTRRVWLKIQEVEP